MIAHAAWREAWERLLAIAAAGPATVVLVGKAGTGKSLLLQEMMPTLRRPGRAVTFVRQGDLPFDFAAGTCLLVDEAARMDEDRLAELAAQQVGLVVLAGLPNFAKRLDGCERLPSVIRLRPMDPPEVRDFVREWLARSGETRATTTVPAIERVVVRSAGIARLVAQMLGAALAIAGEGSVGAADVDEVADLALSGLDSDPVVPSAPRNLERPIAGAMPQSTAWQRRRVPRLRLAAGAAIAATVLLMPIGRSGMRREAVFSAAIVPVPPPGADAGATELAWASAPALAVVPAAAGTERVRPDQAEIAPPLAVAARPAPEELAAAAQPGLADPPSGRPSWPPAEGFHPRAAGGPGLVLVAGASDTLRQLYAEVYRGVQPPPYAQVVAANQVRMQPGAILVFPAPADGWSRR